MKKAIIEFIGTFFFVLTIVITGNPIAIASMLMAWVYIGGSISGGHYNPAVSLAVAIRHKWNWMEFAKYMIAQILGAFAAMQMTLFLTGKSALHLFNIHSSFAQIFTMETFLTFVLAFVVLVVATTRSFKESKIFGLAIGFTIPALIGLGGPVSGGIFNPAIILGAVASIIISGGQLGINSMIVSYITAQLLGAFLAACAFKYFNLDQYINEHN